MPVNLLAAIPVVVIDASAFVPFLVVDVILVVVMVLIRMVLSKSGHAGEGEREGGNNDGAENRLHAVGPPGLRFGTTERRCLALRRKTNFTGPGYFFVRLSHWRG